jgi:hypothetical protein
MQAHRERPLGYSTLAPQAADRTARRLRPLNCGNWSVHPGLVDQLRIRFVAVYRAFYENNPPVRPACLPRARRGLKMHGFSRLRGDGDIIVYGR